MRGSVARLHPVLDGIGYDGNGAGVHAHEREGLL